MPTYGPTSRSPGQQKFLGSLRPMLRPSVTSTGIPAELNGSVSGAVEERRVQRQLRGHCCGPSARAVSCDGGAGDQDGELHWTARALTRAGEAGSEGRNLLPFAARAARVASLLSPAGQARSRPRDLTQALDARRCVVWCQPVDGQHQLLSQNNTNSSWTPGQSETALFHQPVPPS